MVLMHDFSCQRCGECCKRYYIVSLPEELEKQAAFLGLERREFIERHCQLFLQIFPSMHGTQKPVLNRSFLPKKFLEKAEAFNGPLSEFFIVLPMIAFKRRGGGECTFYDSENSGCGIYPARPLECALFPFISDRKIEDYSKAYPFCKGLKTKGENLSYADLSFVHFKQMSEYFKKVKEKGFASLWREWPKEGVLLLESHLLGEISEKEFFHAIGPFA